MSTYRIVRFFMDHPRETIWQGLTLEEAQEHCNDPASSSQTTTDPIGMKLTRQKGSWFDGYEEE